MSDFTDDIEYILGEQNFHWQCMQIVPFGENRCALLWELGTQEHDVAYSLVFELTSFNPGTQRQIFKLAEWCISLASPRPQPLRFGSRSNGMALPRRCLDFEKGRQELDATPLVAR